eukprot:7346075-Prymnesium_polylepis.1
MWSSCCHGTAPLARQGEAGRQATRNPNSELELLGTSRAGGAKEYGFRRPGRRGIARVQRNKLES